MLLNCGSGSSSCCPPLLLPLCPLPGLLHTQLDSCSKLAAESPPMPAFAFGLSPSLFSPLVCVPLPHSVLNSIRIFCCSLTPLSLFLSPFSFFFSRSRFAYHFLLYFIINSCLNFRPYPSQPFATNAVACAISLPFCASSPSASPAAAQLFFVQSAVGAQFGCCIVACFLWPAAHSSGHDFGFSAMCTDSPFALALFCIPCSAPLRQLPRHGPRAPISARLHWKFPKLIHII